MIETAALSPSPGVEVTGVDGLLEERFTYSRDWRAGDLVMGDNTGMLHRALPYDPSSERTLHRTTIFGDEAFS